jgi:hypothetical protein
MATIRNSGEIPTPNSPRAHRHQEENGVKDDRPILADFHPPKPSAQRTAKLAGEAPSGAVDTWLTASAGAGCVGGVGYIAKTYLTSGNGGAGGNYCGRFSFTCNGPGRVKFH